MKLTELDPRWVGSGGEGVTQDGKPAPERHGVAISFICPCGTHPRDEEYETDRCVVPFNNPLDGGARVDTGAGSYWERTGDTFETLTLAPSIQRVGGCKWHGQIQNGEIVPA